MYARVNGSQLAQYPYTVADLRADNPRTAFPAAVDLSEMGDYGVVAVDQAEPPAHDPATQRAVEGPPSWQGDRWVQVWAIEALPAPVAVSRKQARMALVLSGIALSAVQLAIDAIEDDTQRALAQIAWDDAVEYRRDDSFLMLLSGMLGLNDEQLDGLFILASGL